MELYTLDENLRRSAVVEGYASLIWTERFSAYGDFVVTFPESRGARSLLPNGTLLALDKSHRVMRVETAEDNTDDEGGRSLIIKGRSIEAWLEDRAAVKSFAGTTTEAKWEWTGKPAQIVRDLFTYICVTPRLQPGDQLPFHRAGNLLPLGNIPEPADTVPISLEPDTLYNSIKKICDTYNLGFRIVRDGDRSALYFEVYTGSNLHSRQTELPAVIFSPQLENLTNMKQLTSDAQTKNVAYVIAKNGAAVVYASSVDIAVSGFERRVLTVKADDIELPAGDALTAALHQRGLEELAQYRTIMSFDGETNDRAGYVYGRDYSVGDIVEQRLETGDINDMRVTEQIFVDDENGERAYPTLSLNVSINPGTWLSWSSNQTWDQVDPAIYWDNA